MTDQAYSADVVVVGTGVVGCTMAEHVLDAGLSVLMLEAGPRVERWQIVENFRNRKLPCWQVMYCNSMAVPLGSPRAMLLWYGRADQLLPFCCWHVLGLRQEPQLRSSCFC